MCFSYIKERKGNRLEVVDASDPNYMKALETAIRVGQPMLLKVWVEITEFLIRITGTKVVIFIATT